MAAVLYTPTRKWGILALFAFFVATLLTFSFPNTLYLGQLPAHDPHGSQLHEGDALNNGTSAASPPPPAPTVPAAPKETNVQTPPPHDLASPPQSSGGLADVQNATLGFQKIYVLSMPTRRDKRDMMALSAYLSGLEIEFVDGVNGTLMSKAEKPDGYEEKLGFDGHLDNNLGCWRGHIDIYRKMVQDKVQTALVVEDDADWDVMLKAQMTEVARGSRHLQHAKAPVTPYGDDWWIISTGNCASRDHTSGEQQRWVINNDPTAIPSKHRHMLYTPNLRPQVLGAEHSRMMFDLRDIICTASYGISLRGATEMLYDQIVLPNAKTIDFAIGTLCGGTAAGKCFGVFPPIFGTFIPAGDKSKESDRTAKKGDRNNISWANNLVYSARLNIKNLLDGKKIIKSQYPEDSLLKEVDHLSYVYPSGRPVTVPAVDFEEKKEEVKVEEVKVEQVKVEEVKVEEKPKQPTAGP